MPADPRRHHKRLVDGVAALVERAKSTTCGRRYEFFNHCKSSRLETALSQKGFAQTFSATLKFSGEIETGFLSRSLARNSTDIFRQRKIRFWQTGTPRVNSYSHFFH